MNLLNKITQKYLSYRRKQCKILSEKYLAANGCIQLVEELKSQSKSTGVQLEDFASLHYFIKRNKPQFFLECGTGMSTHIIAKAMKDFCYEKFNGNIKLVSMESEEQWYNDAIKNFPKQYNDFLEIKLSPVDYYQYAFLRGTIYKEIPQYNYNAIFVDGPAVNNMCNMDFIRLLENSSHPIQAIVDCRKTSVLAYQSIMDRNFFNQYSFGFCFIGPVTNKDLLLSSVKNLKKTFHSNIGSVKNNVPFLIK